MLEAYKDLIKSLDNATLKVVHSEACECFTMAFNKAHRRMQSGEGNMMEADPAAILFNVCVDELKEREAKRSKQSDNIV